MAVLIEGISVIVRCETIEAHYPGGGEAYVKDAPNKTLCTDALLARIGFMTPYDVGKFISRLEGFGFEFVRDDKAIDVCVVDQVVGPTTRCDWLECLHMNISGEGETVCIAACRIVGDSRDDVFTPANWDIKKSLTRNFRWTPNEEMREQLELIRHENGVDVFRDRSTGKEFYMGRG